MVPSTLHNTLERHTRGYLNYMNMDVSELHDEENLLVQMQDRWENYGSLDGIADTHDPFETTQKAVQKQLVDIVEKLRHHDDSIGLWKYLNR